MDVGTYTGFKVTMEDPGIVVVTFNQPEKLNASNQWIKRDLVETINQVQMEDEARILVITGEGRGFMAGDNIAHDAGYHAGTARVPDIFHGHHNPSGTYNSLRFISQAINVAVRTLDKLSIAAVNGYAIQTGMSLALSCDFRVAAESAKLGSATLRFGLLPDEGGQFLLVQLLGVAKAMDFLMRKRIVSAREALELGLVHEVAPDDQLMARTMELATELANGPQVAMRMLKRSIYNAAELTFGQALDEIASKTAVTDHHPDAIEGMQAFNEKRAPRFNRWLEQG
jgi:2-(1,2-epoxy-1,2-dihydrophenyl)acetyl-CoA isomerase